LADNANQPSKAAAQTKLVAQDNVMLTAGQFITPVPIVEVAQRIMSASLLGLYLEVTLKG
jgi:hypothetical protein